MPGAKTTRRPLLESISATVVSLLVQMPELDVLASVALPVPQNADVPVIAAGAALTTTDVVEMQLEIA